MNRILSNNICPCKTSSKLTINVVIIYLIFIQVKAFSCKNLFLATLKSNIFLKKIRVNRLGDKVKILKK